MCLDQGFLHSNRPSLYNLQKTTQIKLLVTGPAKPSAFGQSTVVNRVTAAKRLTRRPISVLRWQAKCFIAIELSHYPMMPYRLTYPTPHNALPTPLSHYPIVLYPLSFSAIP